MWGEGLGLWGLVGEGLSLWGLGFISRRAIVYRCLLYFNLFTLARQERTQMFNVARDQLYS